MRRMRCTDCVCCLMLASRLVWTGSAVKAKLASFPRNSTAPFWKVRHITFDVGDLIQYRDLLTRTLIAVPFFLRLGCSPMYALCTHPASLESPSPDLGPVGGDPTDAP
jgi:hypothetical protein